MASSSASCHLPKDEILLAGYKKDAKPLESQVSHRFVQWKSEIRRIQEHSIGIMISGRCKVFLLERIVTLSKVHSMIFFARRYNTCNSHLLFCDLSWCRHGSWFQTFSSAGRLLELLLELHCCVQARGIIVNCLAYHRESKTVRAPILDFTQQRRSGHGTTTNVCR